MPSRTVREATFDVLRQTGLTTLFANPGSTEVPFLVDLPSDLRFVLGLHEASVVGMAAGWAIARNEPALAILHTTAGLGNAVGAIATARVNRAPVVVLVGQQDRRHLVHEPFLAGRLDGLAGDYPVWVGRPELPQDVPGLILRARHEAATGRGPALVIVPMDDWSAPADESRELAAPTRLVRTACADERAASELLAFLAPAAEPALVVGAGADEPAAWSGLVALAEKLSCPVWQESFGARAGFPQDHPLFAGHLPADRARLRQALARHDAVLVVGAPSFRQYPYGPGPLTEASTRVAILTEDADEAHRSVAELAVLGSPAALCRALAEALPARSVGPPEIPARPAAPPPPPPRGGEPLRAGHVLSALADLLPADAILVEETPSSRPELHARVPARQPLGFLSAAMGGLGFALPAATGIRMARNDRPVVAVVGDGSSLYGIQALWSAASYGAGVLFIVLSNGGYAVMDRLAEGEGGTGPWPSFTVDVTGLARALGCPAQRITDHDELVRVLGEALPSLADRQDPLLLEIVVAPDETFAP